MSPRARRAHDVALRANDVALSANDVVLRTNEVAPRGAQIKEKIRLADFYIFIKFRP